MERFGSRNRRDAITSRFRLRDYDYSTPGLYFITICTQDRVCRFGRVANDVMILNEPGQMATDCWLDVSSAFRDVSIEHHLVMPNHVHAIIGIGIESTGTWRDIRRCPDVLHWYKSTDNQACTSRVSMATGGLVSMDGCGRRAITTTSSVPSVSWTGCGTTSIRIPPNGNGTPSSCSLAPCGRDRHRRCRQGSDLRQRWLPHVSTCGRCLGHRARDYKGG